MLIVVCGLPGVGKSALAEALGRTLGTLVLSVDPLEAALLRAGIAAGYETGVAAYEVAATLAEGQLEQGRSVIVDAVSAAEEARERWRRAAARWATPLSVIEVTCSDRAAHRRQLHARGHRFPEIPEPTWDQVEARRVAYPPWPEDVLRVDTIRPAADTLAAALTHLRDPRSASDFPS